MQQTEPNITGDIRAARIVFAPRPRRTKATIAGILYSVLVTLIALAWMYLLSSDPRH